MKAAKPRVASSQPVGDRISISDALSRLLRVVKDLQEAYSQKRFTLDGRLVGDLGEVLAEEAYDLTLFDGLEKRHDAFCPDGRKVQIKTTMQGSLTFPSDHVPDYYLGIMIHADGSFSELFNGPGKTIASALARRKAPKTNLHTVTLSLLRKLDQKVETGRRIPLRAKATIRPVPWTRARTTP